MRFHTSTACFGLIVSILLSACNVNSTAEPQAKQAQPSEPAPQSTLAESPSVVPQQERDKAQQLEMDGPTETSGIESLKVLATIELSQEFEPLEGYLLRAREITVAPGGQVAVHQHDSRPGIAYILEGEMVEHRNDQAAPLTRIAGDVATENTGIVHWWKNEGSIPSRALVVDIVPEAE